MRQSMIAIALLLLAAAAAAQSNPYPAPVGTPVPAPAPATQSRPATQPAPVPAPGPAPAQKPEPVFSSVDLSPATEAAAQEWLDEQTRSRRTLLAVIPRGAQEKCLFVMVDAVSALRPFAAASPDLSKESVMARMKGKGLNRTFIGSCHAAEGYLLFFR